MTSISEKHNSQTLGSDNPPPKEDSPYSNVVITEEQVGVYKLLIASSTAPFSIKKTFEEVKNAIPLFQKLFLEIYELDPWLFALFVGSRLWGSVEDAMMMQLSSNLLRTIEAGFVSGRPLVSEIVWALLTRALSTAIVAHFGWYNGQLYTRLQKLVTTHFEIRLMKAKLNLDVPTSLDATSTIDVSSYAAWTSFQAVLEYIMSLVTAFSQVIVIYNAAKASGSPAFFLTCLARPIFTQLVARSIWDKVCYAYASNADYVKMRALATLASGDYREDVLSGELGDWIIKEYSKCRDSLSEIVESHPFFHAFQEKTSVYDIISLLLGDLPMASNIENVIVDGTIAYPPCFGEKRKREAQRGMSFEIRNMSFKYPGSKKTTNALQNIDLSIKAGSVVVIVGSNGSGKSTLLRLLCRLFDPSEGEVLIDGHFASSYKLDSLRQATTLLSQENRLYPLSLGQNIALGCVANADNDELVKDAAEKGGAASFIKKLDKGFATVLDPKLYPSCVNLYGDKEHPLYKKMKALEKKVEISGGEKQRVVAARSFMRMNSGRIHFVAVDEPSSALDAEGEQDLFNRLLEAREGKTIVFVTHRFGYLTRHADLIVCMKDGAVLETGNHDQIMRKDGEYAKLYNIQARAFAEDEALSAPPGSKTSL
ncbi:P-loop containing nucleoside triphosphate hydrolase protein [Coprinopsis marcescibilis]|uniref:P-loop containing nucleoside triphosphate hydrolase protein n=1 Tax=Coprinopsis marcescibilis TaxID=230819 RepID=A0A5C3KMJ7_COPMA|nr:P-loop containing nucleoside triphosphate hydrolase protein [Coprinopsis marcescibilis]